MDISQPSSSNRFDVDMEDDDYRDTSRGFVPANPSADADKRVRLARKCQRVFCLLTITCLAKWLCRTANSIHRRTCNISNFIAIQWYIRGRDNAISFITYGQGVHRTAESSRLVRFIKTKQQQHNKSKKNEPFVLFRFVVLLLLCFDDLYRGDNWIMRC